MSEEKREYSLETKVVNGSHKDQFRASVAPAYLSATFKPNSLSDMGDYDYTRSGNPSRTNVQDHVAKIIKCDYVFATNSGMSALDVIVRTVKPGDAVIAGDDLYGGTHRLLTYLKEKDGVDVQHHDTTDLKIMKEKITKDTKMVFLESPTNPLIKVIDLKSICDHAHSVNPDCVVVFDNTMMSPILMSPLELGADIQYESATKYMNGHHDIMAGIVATNNKVLADKIFYVINATGAGLAPFDSWLLMRGLKTLALRIERQQESAMKIATWLESKGLKVRYPGLKSHPQYELHKSQCKGPGGVLSFETGDVKISETIIEKCELYSITVSFGCVNSLISLPCKMSHASIDEEVRKERDFPEDLIRLCIGIEGVDDLIYDLEQALKFAGVL
ncbi:hypothetical protein CANARDRAFT_173630 [[Candida] arabinofermentans NRRL YB-2248]|uniref:Cystathionine beta-lyase n=1 Tax=[Candida] arabinofermentans NRRL YB-2248 TaxID=983967 RepID=A0A1E4T7I2_9ASCO|nr:hypothetical protein CANARDRAFT_173630 [[Candida] arabinofermentans NRRL YB-2248]